MKTLIIMILFPTILFAQDWTKKTIVENPSENLYVGVSSPRENLKDALAEAYNEAIKEAVKHNFGFNQTLQENFFSTINNTEIQQQSFLKLDNIQIRGVKPINQEIKESNGKYIVYRQISYEKDEINKEKTRLKSMLNDKVITNTYNQSGFNGYLNVYSVPTQAQVVITSEDGKTVLTGTTNGKFNLQLGKYSVFIQKKGYRSVDKEIIVSDNNTDYKVNLIPATGFLTVNPNPGDALVYVDGRQIANQSLELLAGKEYKVRIEHPDFYTKEEVFELAENYNKNLTVSLDPKDGTFSVFSSPDGADVWLDSTKVGKTPLISFKTHAGNHTITVEKEGYDQKTQTVKVMPNTATKPVNVVLEQESTKQRPVYDREKRQIVPRTSSININYKSFPMFLDYSALNLTKKNYKDYNPNSNMQMVDFEYKYKLYSWVGVYIQVGFGFRNVGKQSDELLDNEWTEDGSLAGIGLPVFLTDRLSVTPKLSWFSYIHSGRVLKNYYESTFEVRATGMASGVNLNYDLARFNDVSFNVNAEVINPINVKTVYVNNPTNISGEVKKKTSVGFGFGMTFSWE